MEKKINSTEFKKHLLVSYINKKENCKQFSEFIKLISTTEEDCHNLIIELMRDEYIIYNHNGYELNKNMFDNYKFFTFIDNDLYDNMLNDLNKDAILYLPKSFKNRQ